MYVTRKDAEILQKLYGDSIYNGTRKQIKNFMDLKSTWDRKTKFFNNASYKHEYKAKDGPIVEVKYGRYTGSICELIGLHTRYEDAIAVLNIGSLANGKPRIKMLKLELERGPAHDLLGPILVPIDNPEPDITLTWIITKSNSLSQAIAAERKERMKDTATDCFDQEINAGDLVVATINNKMAICKFRGYTGSSYVVVNLITKKQHSLMHNDRIIKMINEAGIAQLILLNS